MRWEGKVYLCRAWKMDTGAPGDKPCLYRGTKRVSARAQIAWITRFDIHQAVNTYPKSGKEMPCHPSLTVGTRPCEEKRKAWSWQLGQSLAHACDWGFMVKQCQFEAMDTYTMLRGKKIVQPKPLTTCHHIPSRFDYFLVCHPPHSFSNNPSLTSTFNLLQSEKWDFSHRHQYHLEAARWMLQPCSRPQSLPLITRRRALFR